MFFWRSERKNSNREDLYRVKESNRFSQKVCSSLRKQKPHDQAAPYDDNKFAEYRAEHQGNDMPTWDKLRRAMPSWKKIHETYDKHSGDMRRAEKPDYANWMPKGMEMAAAAGTGALLTADIAAHIVSKGNRTTGTKVVCAGLSLGTTTPWCFKLWFYFFDLF